MIIPSIEVLEKNDFDSFIDYMNEHLADNGRAGTGYFQPLSQDDSSFSPEREAGFRAGLDVPVGSQGWRRAWVLRSESRIIGHVDLRSYLIPFAQHRCLLGMGVDRRYRRLGIGRALVEHARHWASVAGLEWIDLQVLSENHAAISLYLQAGFARVGEVPKMFLIDGHDFSYATMTLQLKAERQASGQVI